MSVLAKKIGRRSTLGPSALDRELIELPSVPTTKAAVRLQKRTFEFGSDQLTWLRRTSLELQLEGSQQASQALLLRAAVEWLRSLPRGDLLDVLEDQESWEQDLGIGSGIPRPRGNV